MELLVREIEVTPQLVPRLCELVSQFVSHLDPQIAKISLRRRLIEFRVGHTFEVRHSSASSLAPYTVQIPC